MAEPGTTAGDGMKYPPPGEAAAPHPDNEQNLSGENQESILSSAAVEDLKYEFERLKLHFKPLVTSAKDYAQTEARLKVFETKENARLAVMRLIIVIAASLFALTAWILFSVFLYQLTRYIAPGLPWLAPLVVAVVHLIIAGSGLAYTNKLRL